MQIQQARVDMLCKRLKHPGSYEVLNRQMLVSDEDKVAFCYAPKTGCTTLKTLLFLKLGKNITCATHCINVIGVIIIERLIHIRPI